MPASPTGDTFVVEGTKAAWTMGIVSARAAIPMFALGATFSGTAHSETMAEWSTQAAREIARQYRVPPIYNRPPEPRMIVQFRVDRSGTISEISVIKSSGMFSADEAGIRAVRAAQPLKPPPMDAKFDSVLAKLPIAFR